MCSAVHIRSCWVSTFSSPSKMGSQVHDRYMASVSWLLLRPWQASSHALTIAKTVLDNGSSREGLSRRFIFCLNGTKRHPETLKRRKSSNILHLYLEMRIKDPTSARTGMGKRTCPGVCRCSMFFIMRRSGKTNVGCHACITLFWL